jgi:hypothetical protein
MRIHKYIHIFVCVCVCVCVYYVRMYIRVTYMHKYINLNNCSAQCNTCKALGVMTLHTAS